MNELMNDNRTVHRFIDDDGNKYGVRVISRGETLFFQKNEKSLICVIDIAENESTVHIISIKKWHDESNIKKSEKYQIIQDIKKYYECAYGRKVILV